MNDITAEQLAELFHTEYERLAPEFDYKTRQQSAVPWAEVPENNRRLMIAVCDSIQRWMVCAILIELKRGAGMNDWDELKEWADNDAECPNFVAKWVTTTVQRIAELEAEWASLIRAHEDFVKSDHQQTTEIEALKFANQRLREALDKYGRHREGCAIYSLIHDTPCDCGWAEGRGDE